MVYPVIQYNKKTPAVVVKNLLGANATEKQMKWFSLEQQVTDRTPPAFLAHAINDKIVNLFVFVNNIFSKDALFLQYQLADFLIATPNYSQKSPIMRASARLHPIVRLSKAR